MSITRPVIANTETQSPAAPTPETALPKMRKLMEGVTAQNKLPKTNITAATRRTVLGGMTFRSFP